MGSILPFLPRGVFDDAATKAMGDLFRLYGAIQPLAKPSMRREVVQEAIARRIVAAARKGERGVERLRNAALAGLAGIRRDVDESQRR